MAEFGYLHTSTFADDDFSAAIGLGALDLVTRDDGALMRACREKGDYLLERLHTLQEYYPGVISEVRGRGLLLGVKLAPLHASVSNLLRAASEQRLLGSLVTGYLLHEEDIRVAWTLSVNNTIRLEPSAYIDYANLDRFGDGLERAVAAIARADAHLLVRALAGHRAEPDRELLQPQTTTPVLRLTTDVGPIARRVACLCHFIEPEHLVHWDPTLSPLTADECSRLLARTDPVVEPFVAEEIIVRGPTGERVALVMIALLWTSEQIMIRIRGGDLDAVRAKIEAAVDLARRKGCGMVGFAGYTSIATDNCRSLIEHRIGLTTGNSLTAAAALAVTRQFAEEAGIEPASTRLGIVGALGNIGRVIAEVEAERVATIVLVGRPGGERRLLRLVGDLYAQAWVRLRQGTDGGGITRALLHAFGTPGSDNELDGAALRTRVERELGPRAPIAIATDLAALRTCNVIFAASNAPQPVLGPEHESDHPIVICDVAVPSDVRMALAKERPNARVLKGGIVRLPAGQDFAIRGMALTEGQAYACVAEVILLGLAGIGEHFSYGALSAQRVRQIGALARRHGFTFAARA